jgi:hypothetical protein
MSNYRRCKAISISCSDSTVQFNIYFTHSSTLHNYFIQFVFSWNFHFILMLLPIDYRKIEIVYHTAHRWLFATFYGKEQMEFWIQNGLITVWHKLFENELDGSVSNVEIGVLKNQVQFCMCLESIILTILDI